MIKDDDRKLVEECLKNNPKAQKRLYDRFSSRMYGICMRFSRNHMEAEDILQEGFIKVFSKLSEFNFTGAFEGWVRRIFINSAINYYKSRNSYLRALDNYFSQTIYFADSNIVNNISERELLSQIQKLPDGYRMIFNLNVIEGYTHKEIGKLLNISTNTSKSQLAKARRSLQHRIMKNMPGNDVRYSVLPTFAAG